ncbi:MAG: hypothetical protein HQM12_17135 [SAR324 cluster bacterium]|nr:hypothetical protein [SAR324 cluster bacterium]MBF0352175.1 hypothetical protein [SAR324 cluster bacterium]
MSKANELLEAHLQFELEQFTGKNLVSGLKEELSAAYQWLGKIKISDIFSAEQVKESLRKNVMDVPVPDEARVFIRKCEENTYEYMKDHETRWEEVLPKRMYDKFTEQTEIRRKLRKEFIHEMLNVPIYARMISDVVYSNLKEFALMENPVAKKIPGASKLLNMGKNFIGDNLSGLEASLEKNIKQFIEKQINTSIRQSEDFLNRELDGELYRKLTDDLWKNFHSLKIHKGMEKIRPDLLDELEPVIKEFWDSFRVTPLCFEVASGWIDVYFKDYGNRTIQSLLTDVGWDEARVLAEGTHWAIPVLEKAVESGYVSERLRHRLEKFYKSKAAKELLK